MSLHTACRRCHLIRIYLGIAFGLILMIGLQPEQAKLLASLVPSPLVLAIVGMVLGSLAFVLRLRAWRRETAASHDG